MIKYVVRVYDEYEGEDHVIFQSINFREALLQKHEFQKLYVYKRKIESAGRLWDLFPRKEYAESLEKEINELITTEKTLTDLLIKGEDINFVDIRNNIVLTKQYIDNKSKELHEIIEVECPNWESEYKQTYYDNGNIKYKSIIADLIDRNSDCKIFIDETDLFKVIKTVPPEIICEFIKPDLTYDTVEGVVKIYYKKHLLN